jgi:hypothetical protein
VRSWDRSRWVETGIAAVAAIILIGLAVMITAGTNYTGEGNEFQITATVDHVTNQSVFVTGVQEETPGNGKADTWFSSGQGELHDNYTRFIAKNKVGHIYDSTGQPIDLARLQPGSTIRAVGKIRSSYYTPTRLTRDRAVFDRIDVIG